MSKQLYRDLSSSKRRKDFQNCAVQHKGSTKAAVNDKEVPNLFPYIIKLLSEK